MEKKRRLITKRILNLTLEIIYLLTGEDYAPLKKSDDHVTPSSHPLVSRRWSRNQSLVRGPPPLSLIPEKINHRKILQLTSKITEVLTGEELDYLEEDIHYYEDIKVAKSQMRQLGDGSSHRKIPERCPRPLDSRDFTQEHHEIPQTRPLYSRDSTQERHEIPQTHPLYSRDSTQEHQEIPQTRPLYSQDSTQECHEILHQDQVEGEDVIAIKAEVYDDEEEPYLRGDEPCKEVEMPPEISTDGSSNRKSTERCPRPLYSRDFTQEDHTIPHHDQFENDAEDKVYMTSYQQCKEEECPIEINAAEEHDVMRTSKGHLRLSPCWDREDDDLKVSPTEDRATPHLHPGLKRSPAPSILQESSSDKPLSLIPDSNLGLCGADWPSGPANPEETVHHKALRGNKLHLCSFCGKRFTTHANVVRHVRTHTGDRPYSCSLCGKSFTQKSILLNHQKVHTGDRPFPCPDCGKCFAKSSDVIRHRRVHTGERPYLCLECGKSFTQKFRLRNHQHFHKEEEQSRRLECGWGLASKSNQFR